VDQKIVSQLRTGDFIGIYSQASGLDVSHVGLAVRKDGVLHFRHASSAQEFRRVIDQDFFSYVAPRPGIVGVPAQRRPPIHLNH